jgi:serralysin
MASPTTDELNDVTFESGVNANGTIAEPSFATWNGSTGYSATSDAAKWANNSSGQTLSYTTTAGTPGGTVTYSFGTGVTAAQQNAFAADLALWSDEANITFAPATSGATADVVFNVTNTGGTSNTTAPAETTTAGSTTLPAFVDPSTPGGGGAQDTITFNNSGSYGTIGDFNAQGGYGESALTHEIGHMLGLGHSGPYNDGTGTASAAASQYNEFDSRQWSVMSYIEPSDTTATYYSQYTVTGTQWVSSGGYEAAPETPMIDDILSAQRLYGAATTGQLTQAQTFGFNCTITDGSNAFFNFNTNVNPIITIYDSSATGSTLDCSGFSTNCVLNLNPGTFSTASAGTLTNNIGIAYNTKVDTAIGGSGNDTFYVNTDSDTINGGAGTNTVVFTGNEAAYTFVTSGATTVVTSNAGGTVDTLNDVQSLQFADATVAVCFCSGTHIRTDRGDVLVEHLAVGDRVVTASGASRPIRWLGHRHVLCRTHPAPGNVWPVKISAHALGPNKPAKDLFVSPGHAICVDLLGEVLIPAASLVNATTICQVEVDAVTYWHVELDTHDLLIAENVPAESYLEVGNRGFFQDAPVVSLIGAPDGSPRTHADYCRPCHGAGPLVAAARYQTQRRAEAAGWTLDATDPIAGLHLLVDGARVEPEMQGLAVRFPVPAGATTLCLVSHTSRPCDVDRGDDGRALGVHLVGLAIERGVEAKAIALDDPALGSGFYPVEDGARRWTSGRAELSSALWAGETERTVLRLDLAGPALPRWVPPVAPLALMSAG